MGADPGCRPDAQLKRAALQIETWSALEWAAFPRFLTRFCFAAAFADKKPVAAGENVRFRLRPDWENRGSTRTSRVVRLPVLGHL